MSISTAIAGRIRRRGSLFDGYLLMQRQMAVSRPFTAEMLFHLRMGMRQRRNPMARGSTRRRDNNFQPCHQVQRQTGVSRLGMVGMLLGLKMGMRRSEYLVHRPRRQVSAPTVRL